MKVSVSFLTSKNIKKDLLKLDSTDANYLHVDVMDKRFVKGKNNPYLALKMYSSHYRKRLDVHLMVDEPLKYIKKYVSLNTEYITFHVEIKEDLKELINYVKSYNIKCGLAIKPETPIELLDSYLPFIDQILVMSVEPGRGGQVFIKKTEERVKKIKKMVKDYPILVSVDGGINEETRKMVKEADMVVSGTYILSSDNYQERIDDLR